MIFYEFCIFSKFEPQIPSKFEKYMKFLGFFQNTISKCYDLIGKNTPLPTNSSYSSPSMKLKLLLSHIKTPPCRNFLKIIRMILVLEPKMMKLSPFQDFWKKNVISNYILNALDLIISWGMFTEILKKIMVAENFSQI